jgi:ferredoxin--NADP+ reductase
MSHSVAIIGSGPAGFYCAEAICKKAPQVRIDLIDRLPTPFGLVRSGVAPDHQGTKSVWRVFHRTANREQVRFIGNVEVGRDVSVADLLEIYDAVVLAVGAVIDRKLGIEGEHLSGVYGSGAFTAWYNGHPDFSDLSPELRGPGIAVVGNGNVAVDVVRVLGRTRSEMAVTDLPDYAMRTIESSEYTDIYMLGRRGPMEASFTTAELRELGDMTETVALVDPAQLPEAATADDPKQQKLKEKILETLRGYSTHCADEKPKRLHMRFFAAPMRVLGTSHVEGLEVAVTRLEKGRAVMTDETYVLDVGTVISAIGYTAIPLAGVPISEWGTCYANVDGKIQDRLWAVGWAKRGPSGVIATNRQDSGEVADKLLAECKAEPRPGPSALDHLLAQRAADPILYSHWERIDETERTAAPEGAPRRKLTSFPELIKAGRG